MGWSHGLNGQLTTTKDDLLLGDPVRHNTDCMKALPTTYFIPIHDWKSIAAERHSWHLAKHKGICAFRRHVCCLWTRIGKRGVVWCGVVWCGVVWRCTAQHSTAQHSTAQHSTAQHSTAQHSTAQHSTAQHCITIIMIAKTHNLFNIISNICCLFSFVIKLIILGGMYCMSN